MNGLNRGVSVSARKLVFVAIGFLALVAEVSAQKPARPGDKKPPARPATPAKDPPKAPAVPVEPAKSSAVPNELSAVEKEEVEKYANDLKAAGLSADDIKVLKHIENKERLEAKQKRALASLSKPAQPPAPKPAQPPANKPAAGKPAAPPPGAPAVQPAQIDATLGAFVRAAIARGLHGQDLADAIHEEQTRRQHANDPVRPATPLPPPAKDSGAGTQGRPQEKPTTKPGLTKGG